MPSNVEIKARLADRARAVAVAKELSGSEGEVLEQEDTFFRVAEGRLKVRFSVWRSRYSVQRRCSCVCSAAVRPC